MKKITLNAQNRTLLGRKVKNLRKQNLIPGSVYGNQVKSLAIQVKQDDFQKALAQAGETQVIDLSIDGAIKPVLIKNTQIHAVTSAVVHVDFYQVDLTVKVKANVPVEIVGIAQAVSDNLGVLLQLIDELEVEALPQDLPENITVDVSKLAEVNASVKIKEVKLPSGVTVEVDPEQELVKIGALIQEEPKEETPVTEVVSEAPEGETAEGKETAPVVEKTPEEKEKK